MLDELEYVYNQLKQYIADNPFYETTYEPYTVEGRAPKIVVEMAKAAGKAHVGPMASVAGAISEHIRDYLLAKGAKEVIVENGGDIALKITNELIVGLYAGNSPYSGKIALRIQPGQTPLGVCTSSGSLGHSVSLGEADSVTVLSSSAAYADAAATAIANEVRDVNPVKKALSYADRLDDISGVLIIKDGELGAKGSILDLVGI